MAEPIRLSNSKANCWRRCPKQYDFRYERKLRAKRIALPLKKGDWLHQLLMVHYDGQDWKIRQRELTQKFGQLFQEEKEEYGNLPLETARIMTSYLQHYKHEDNFYKIIDSEIDVVCGLPNGDTFNFIIDLVVQEEDGSIWIWDHKNVSSFMDSTYMELDNQLLRYAWGARQIGIKDLRGVVFNELCTKAPTIPELGARGELTRRKDLQCDVYTYLREIHKQELNPQDYKAQLKHLLGQSDKWFRRTRMPADKKLVAASMHELAMTSREIKAASRRREFPRSVDKSCTWMCEYLQICRIERQGGDIKDIVRHRFDTAKREVDLEHQYSLILKGGD